ncbi:NTE family protein [Winogradskyella epiphytica]|uniref:NTE family protein n=1 Tax=Winogradskyella epiphytica TaxID=262005 RepID=A0A2V4WUM9_9FLAO|nr:patatin-like phospholipase family protein [Winogradskyella epiphytica]PYE80138.1 NTE family protein [Winogradskyella epiphytica]GGW71644.1 phospholipase [Winogradskyella epiphytica]
MSIGLVLSGGGMRGAAHIGVIKALEEHGIHATHITGTSAGAIVGALYSYGYNWEEILVFFKSFQLVDITKYAYGKPGFIDADKYYPMLKTYLKEDNFKFLKRKLTITATDILEGNLKTFSRGELIKPVLASAAFPGVFSPVKMKNSYYVDGGVLNNFPVDLLKSKCDLLIGIYVNGFHHIKKEDIKHSYSVVERAFKIKSYQEDLQKFKDCDMMIAPNQLGNYGTFDKKNIDVIFKIGYETAIEAIESNADLLSKYNL